MEAYGVLSVSESRASYDLLRRKRPDDFIERTEEEFTREVDPSKRDERGEIRTGPAPGSYAELRMKELAEQRKQYNVNHIGYYKGGVPVKGRGAMRGSALGPPGEFHLPQVHNRLNFYHPDSTVVNSDDALKFKSWMQSDKNAFNMSKPSHPMHYDKDFSFSKDRRFWMALFFGTLGFMWVCMKIPYELDRMQRWDRLENLKDMPAHHFNNRGGVLIRKRFIGFEKYHKNTDEMMDWYYKAYPNVLGTPQK
jgi:hypothetical protein